MDSIVLKDSPVNEQRFRPGMLELLVGGVSFLLYCGTLAFKFVYDDRQQVLDNITITQWRYVPEYFANGVWALIDPHKAGGYYRPLFLLWLKINYSLFRLGPAGWHALSVLLHVIATIQTFWLARRILKTDIAAAVAALLFAVHPVHIESVAWVSGATDPLVTVFMLAAVLGFLRFLDHWGTGEGWPLYVASIAFAALALLSKEIAIVLPILLIATALVTRDRAVSTRKIWQLASPFFVVTLAYFAVRYSVLHALSRSLSTYSAFDVLLTWPSMVVFYLRQLLVPLWISPYASVYWVTSPSARHFWIPLAVCVVIIAVTLIIYRNSSHRRTFLALFAWVVLPLLPAFYISVFPTDQIVHDRYLYLSSVGFSILVVLVGQELAPKIFLSPKLSLSIIKVASATLIALLAFLTFSGELDWASDLLLFTRGVAIAPDNNSAVMNLGVALIENNRPAEGSRLLRLVCARDPNFADAAHNLGRYFYANHQDAEAETLLRRAVMLDPGQEYWLIEYAGVELRLGKIEEAESAARQALRLRPDGTEFHVVLGAILAAKGDSSGAEDEYGQELRLHPDSVRAKAALKSLSLTRF